MPGGRLTHEDRRHIERGLADRLGYAEIARRLRRPTSTVTREVNRNGGPGGYVADRAHRSAVDRARRRRPARPVSPGAPAAADPADGRDPAAVRAFEEHFTGLLIASGLPRMMARVLTCLFATDSGSLTAAELVRRLGVSPASISSAVGYLEKLELIRRERDPRRRHDRYVIGEDVWYGALMASIQATVRLADAAREGAGALGADTPAGIRLDDVGRFLGNVGNDMLESADHWREVFKWRRIDRQAAAPEVVS